jgi:hypothetical protein
MKKYTIIYLLSIAFISACTSEKKQEAEVLIDIRDLVNIESIGYNDSKFFTRCEAIKLEMSEESLIGTVSQLEMSDEYIYILDKKTMSLKVFDRLGNYVRSIGNRGEGTGEFLAVNAFYINPYSRTVNLFDPLKLCVHKYSMEGDFIEAVKYKDLYVAHIARATLLDNGTLFCFTNPTFHDEAGYFVLNEANYSMKEQIYQYPVPIKKEMAFNILVHPYTYYNKEVHFVSLFSNTIRSYTDEKTLPLYYVDNGKREDIDYLKSVTESMEGNYLHIIKRIAEDSKCTVGLRNIYETDRYLYVDFFTKNLLSSAVLWDKETDTGYYFNNYSYKPDFCSIVYNYDNTLVRIWNCSDIELFKEEIEKGHIEKDNYPREILEIADLYDEEDNPVLLLYTM